MNTYSAKELARTLPVDGKFQLIQLPYEADALMPVISKTTIDLHHGKHQQGSVNNLNAALEAHPEFNFLSLEEIVCAADGAVLNNAGQILNHNLYFEALRGIEADYGADAENAANLPEEHMANAINTFFGSFENFRETFTAKGTSLFGSGWVWLSADKDGELHITQAPNAQNPVQHGLNPLLCFDVWEHAYYVDYQNRRAEHLSNMWKLVNWRVVEARYLRLR